MSNRSDSRIRDGVRALVSAPQVAKPLDKLAVRGSMPQARGTSSYSETPSGGGGGITGPLTEVANTREYYAESVVMPSNGYFVYSVKAVKKLTLLDGDNNHIEVNLSEPGYE